MPLIRIPSPEPLPGPLPEPFPTPIPVAFPVPFPRPFPKPFPLPWFRECTPKILVVTDGLNYSPSDAFGLTEFVGTLRATAIHNMTPIVVTAQFNPSPLAALSYDAVSQHISNYKFTDSTHGVRITRYDVVFILAISSAFGPKLTDEAGALDAVTAFMQAGGGLFATGDHEDLGAAMCMDIPRVKNMRYWTNTAPQRVPSAGGVDRLTTSLPGRGDVIGSNDAYEFGDQSDQFPQRLYVNFRSEAGGVGSAHPILQVPASTRAIEVFPDHPHEGECIIPLSLATKMPDGVTDEWPTLVGVQPAPEMVALTMSHGNAFPGKAAVVPRSFIAICAYDGQRANVGRVVTDATWHHFVNINIKPGMSALEGRDLEDIKQYYANLAQWLMPKAVRYCRRFPWLLGELVRYPLFEELSPIPRSELNGARLRAIGEVVEKALLSRHTRAEVQALIEDALEEGLGAPSKANLEKYGRELGSSVAHEAGLAALGALTLATAERFNELEDKQDLNGEKAFEGLGKKSSQTGAKLYLSEWQKSLSKMGELMNTLAR